MPIHSFPYHALWQELENGLLLGEALLFPELSRLAVHRERVIQRLAHNLQQLLPKVELGDLHRRAAPMQVDVIDISLTLPSPPRLPAWREPLQLSFRVVRWKHGAEACLAYVPALGLEVAVGKIEDLEPALESEIRLALMRSKASASLRSLVECQRARKVTTERLTVDVDLPSPKRRAQDAERAQQKKKTILDEVCTNLRKVELPPSFENGETIAKLASLLGGNPARSVLLVGASGVGKTAAWNQFVRDRKAHGLGVTPFYATSGSRLVAGQTGYGMWQQRCRDLCREAGKRRAIMHLGNLIELMDVGKSEGNPSGIASFLRPSIARGELLAVVECTPEQLPIIERDDPLVADVFQVITVAEPTPEQSRTIMDRHAKAQPLSKRQVIHPDVLDIIDRLHRRYATYSAFPGRPLRFLQNLLNDHAGRAKNPTEGRPRLNDSPKQRKRRRRRLLCRDDQVELEVAPRPITVTDVFNAFARETGLPRFLLDPGTSLDLQHTHEWFARRVIGQPEPVELLTALMGTVKAGLTPPQKPIASLLFVGPTGVGKTEMAKSVAAFLFGSPQRLTRFDMSEYGDPISVRRLVGTAFGTEGLLTSRVREQPFCVILLDEFEKAHPSFFDLLLQMLGEGRLTDAAGRLADFRNAVIILTSNLGAESYRQGQYGYQSANGPSPTSRQPATEHFTREVQRFLRPEMFNRIDRIVAFTPLDPATVGKIAERELGLIRERDGIRYRGIQLAIEAPVAEFLATAGYDAWYGARPLKRAIERRLLIPLADQLNGYAVQTALNVDVKQAGGELSINVKPRIDDGGQIVSALTAQSTMARIADECMKLRRHFQRLEQCPDILEIRNDLFQLERIEKNWLDRLARGRAKAQALKNPLSSEDQSKLARHRELIGNLQTQGLRSREMEDESLLTLYATDVTDADKQQHLDLIESERQTLEKAWRDVVLLLYCKRFTNADSISLAFFAEDREVLFEFASAYALVAQDLGVIVSEVVGYRTANEAPKLSKDKWAEYKLAMPQGRVWHENVLYDIPTNTPLYSRIRPAQRTQFLAEIDPTIVAVGLEFQGLAAFPRLAPEDGVHILKHGRGQSAIRVVATEILLEKYGPATGMTRRGATEGQPQRRLYDRAANTVMDLHLGALWWRSGKLASILSSVIEQTLQKNMEELLEK